MMLDNSLNTDDTEEKKSTMSLKLDGAGKETQGMKNEEEDEEDDNLRIKFNKPYIFEEETHEYLDLSGLENLNTKDLTEIEKKYFKNGISSFMPENTSTYAKIVAQRATGHPIEFFDQLPVKEMMKIKNVVTGFFYN